MVVNPTWHIPDSIAIRDYLPKLQRDPMVLKQPDIDLLTRAGTEINPKLVDFTQYTPENFPFRIKQRPSDDNALGQVKFMFPNRFSVYMHDTPHRELFAARRARLLQRLHPAWRSRASSPRSCLPGRSPTPAAAYAGWLAAKKERARRPRADRSPCTSSTARPGSTTTAPPATAPTSTAATPSSSRRWRRRA